MKKMDNKIPTIIYHYTNYIYLLKSLEKINKLKTK